MRPALLLAACLALAGCMPPAPPAPPGERELVRVCHYAGYVYRINGQLWTNTNTDWERVAPDADLSKVC